MLEHQFKVSFEYEKLQYAELGSYSSVWHSFAKFTTEPASCPSTPFQTFISQVPIQRILPLQQRFEKRNHIDRHDIDNRIWAVFAERMSVRFTT